MKLTKEQWLKKLKSFVPSWVFEEESTSLAIFSGISAVLEQIQEDADGLKDETFLDTASTRYLDWHGDERNSPRLFLEKNIDYAARIKNIVNKSNIEALKKIVNALLIKGQCRIVEHWNGNNFYGRDPMYFNRDILTFTVLYNAFSIIVDEQKLTPVTFCNRLNFYNRESFIGSSSSSLILFQRIVEAVNRSKAFGTAYRLIETR